MSECDLTYLDVDEALAIAQENADHGRVLYHIRQARQLVESYDTLDKAE